MNFVNAIAKVRFNASKPQRVILHKGTGLLAELLCLEAGQEASQPQGEWTYYVVAGTALVNTGGQPTTVPAGQFVSTSGGEPHSITASGGGRLVCLAVEATSD